MIKIIQGNLVAQDDKYAIVIARFNDFIGSKLLMTLSAQNCLKDVLTH